MGVNEVTYDGSADSTVKTVENYGASGNSGSGNAYLVEWDLTDSTNFEYATQCSNRGTCDYSTGVCSCFTGYSNEIATPRTHTPTKNTCGRDFSITRAFVKKVNWTRGRPPINYISKLNETPP